MVFSDLFFLFAFLPAFLLCYLLGAWADGRRLKGRQGQNSAATPGVQTSAAPSCLAFRNAVLVLFSLVFYAWGEPIYVLLMLGCVLINYMAGRAISASKGHGRRAVVLGVAANIVVLGVFKYAGFLAECLQGLGIPVPTPHIALPIGISFYIFQSITYLVDVYRGESAAQRRFTDLLLYISMFPQLIAGPIVRYGTVAEEINNRKVSLHDVSDGAYRFLIGLGKKVIIANQLGEVADQFLGQGLAQASTLGIWLGLLAFTLQIYFDFSGYSDMAIGIGRCLGFHFNENFNHPYCCSSVTDFWRRWHMSLGTFFRDYVYIPLGGNRRHQWVNILCVWFLTGMWHGASWNFIFWGLYFGVLLVVEKLFLLRLAKAVPVLGHLYSLVVVYLGWGIFYFDDLGQLQTFLCRFFGAEQFSDFVATQAFFDKFWLWMTALVLCMPVRAWVEKWLRQSVLGSVLRMAVSLAILVISVTLLVGATNNAFLYFRF